MSAFKLWWCMLWLLVWPPAFIEQRRKTAGRERLISLQDIQLTHANAAMGALERYRDAVEHRHAELLAKSEREQRVREAALVFYAALHDAGVDSEGSEFKALADSFDEACSAYLLAEAKVIGAKASKQLLDHNGVELCGCDEACMLRDQLREHQALHDACTKWFHEVAPTTAATLREPEVASLNAELAEAVCDVIGYADA
jgi:hypothetical protein